MVFMCNVYGHTRAHACQSVSGTAAEWLQAAVADLSSLDQQVRPKGFVTPPQQKQLWTGAEIRMEVSFFSWPKV